MVDQDGQPRLTHPPQNWSTNQKDTKYYTHSSIILIGWSGRTATFNAPPQNWSTNQKDTKYYTHSSIILICWSGRTATFNTPPQNWSTNQKDTKYYTHSSTILIVDQDGQPRLTDPHRTDQPIKKTQNIIHTQV